MFAFCFFVAAIFLALYGLGLVTMTSTASITADGVQGNKTITTEGENGVKANPTLTTAKPGVLTTRTSNTVGTLTMETGHGIITGDRIDIYWDGGSCHSCTVGTVAGLSVPFTTAVGDALPIATTAVYAAIANEAVFNAVGNNVQGLLLSATVAGWFVIADGSGDLFSAYVEANSSYYWQTGQGVTNPLAGDTATKIFMSQSGTTSEVTGNSAVAVVA